MTNHNDGQAENLVSNHVIYCQSSLVDELLQKEVFNYDDIENLYQYTCPQCGHGESDVTEFENNDDDNSSAFKCPNCDKLFDDEPESEPQEIFEWWLVTDYLSKQLNNHGEPILKNDFGTWWGRTTTGQSVYMDGVIQSIANQ